MAVKHWALQLFIAIDQLLNVLVTPLSGGFVASLLPAPR